MNSVDPRYTPYMTDYLWDEPYHLQREKNMLKKNKSKTDNRVLVTNVLPFQNTFYYS